MSRDVYSVAQTVPSEATKWSEPFLTPEPWVADALCATVGGDSWFPKRDDSKSSHDAIKVCLACDVQAQCLEYALRMNEQEGIYGGLTVSQRNKLKRGRAA